MDRRGEAPWQTVRARTLRSAETPAELRLWQRLRNRRLGGYKFVRQHAICDYYVDFVCRGAKLVVEVDGGTHSTDDERRDDEIRTGRLEELGYRVLRFGNHDVFDNIEGVVDSILAVLRSEPSI